MLMLCILQIHVVSVVLRIVINSSRIHMEIYCDFIHFPGWEVSYLNNKPCTF